jgi:hypothetical protein
MTEIGFAPKEIIPQEVCTLEVMAADKADTYGPQIYLKLKVVGGEHDGYTFNDYSNRDEDTGQNRKAVRGPGHPDQDRLPQQGRARHRRTRA